jgi:hypothetical protein
LKSETGAVERERVMESKLHLQMLPQPDETTCGPACLHAVYNYYGDDISLDTVVREVKSLKGGGTLEVFLGCHALRRGYSAMIYTYNLKVFDPSWFAEGMNIREKLVAQMKAKDVPKLRTATEGYLEFLSLGGDLRFEDLTTALIRKYLNRGIPVLAGLSSTYLYKSSREYVLAGDSDDVRGEAVGHFVALSGYDKMTRNVLVSDPMTPNPLSEKHHYEIMIDRVLCAILLGVLTYDANLLIIRPHKRQKHSLNANSDNR